jgi:uncharacterized protein YqjF (DUF2071 family)
MVTTFEGKPLAAVRHRPWPLPSSPWIMVQIWHDLLFAHWPVPAEALTKRIPADLRVDTFEGQAWVGVVPFRMSGVRLRGTPALPWLSAFPEMNVRTYVTMDDKPGVWFFSLDAARLLAVWAARRTFHLPYYHAAMACTQGDREIDYQSERRCDPEVRFCARYTPVGREFEAQRGSLEHWLTERYCLYAADAHGAIYRGEIHHPPWKLQSAEAAIHENSMTQPLGIALREERPLLHFARRQDVLVWAPRRVA